MLRVKSDKSDRLRMRNDYFAQGSKIGPSQRSQFLVLTKSSATSRNENGARTHAQHLQNGGFYQTAWLARDRSSFFSPRERVPGPNDFLFSLSEEIALFLILYTVNIDQSIKELKITTENESIASSRKT